MLSKFAAEIKLIRKIEINKNESNLIALFGTIQNNRIHCLNSFWNS